MKMVSKKTNKLIAEKAVQFLKNRMILNQQIIGIQWTNSALRLEKNPTISYDDFMSKHNDLEKRIWAIKDSKNPQRRELVQMCRELERVYGNFITLSEEQIDELMGFARKSIETLGLGEIACSSNETFFLRGVLRRLIGDMEEKLGDAKENNEEYQKLSNWLSYIYLTETVGFNDTISGTLSHGYMGKALSISTRDCQSFCSIDFDGVDKVTEPLDEDILIGNNIYVGSLYKSNDNGELEESFTILLKKEVDGKPMMKAIYVDNKNYPVEESEDNKEYAKPFTTINNFFAMKGLNHLVRDVYDRYAFDQAIQAFNENNSMSDEQRQQTEKVIQVAVDWWANAVCHPRFDNGDKSDIGGMAMLLAMMNNASKPRPQEDTIKQFKQYLSDEIRTGLANNPRCYTLSVDYDPDRALYDAAKKAKLSADFPWKTTMWISNDEVSVSAGYGAGQEVLYSTKQSKETMDGETSQGPKR